MEGNGEGETAEPDLRGRVAADEAVKRVLEVFGGRIDKVEETS